MAPAYYLAITGSVLQRCMETLKSGHRRSLLLPAGISRLPDRVEFLVARLSDSDIRAEAGEPALFLRTASSLTEVASRLDSDPAYAPREMAIITIGTGTAAGHLSGYCLSRSDCCPLEAVRVVDAGLASIQFKRFAGPSPSPVESLRWSRTVGALGERTWRRLRDLNVAVIGCGRSGSLMANSLARVGVRSITLIDPDRLETHNVGEMDLVSLSDVPSLKVDALAERLWHSVPHLRVSSIPESALSSRALVALKGTDLFVSSVDNGSARYTAAMLAKLYLRPLLDIGTGILGAGTSRQLGADIRLILPDRCLLCFGGLADESAARSGFFGLVVSGRESPPAVDWHQQRAGSLRSLNQTATGLALRLLEDFIAARVGESTWIHLDFDRRGIPLLESRSPSPNPECPACPLAGRGDEGIAALHETLRAAASG
jgi:molybdopterin/thiamine biosynthesis adenylyltransferase